MLERVRAPLRHLDRRRVPGRQPGAGAADRAARRPRGSRAVRRRRRRPGDLPVARHRRAQHRRVHAPLPRRRDVHDRHQPPQPPGDHRRRRQPLLAQDRRTGSPKTMRPAPVGRRRTRSSSGRRGHRGRAGRDDRATHINGRAQTRLRLPRHRGAAPGRTSLPARRSSARSVASIPVQPGRRTEPVPPAGRAAVRAACARGWSTRLARQTATGASRSPRRRCSTSYRRDFDLSASRGARVRASSRR